MSDHNGARMALVYEGVPIRRRDEKLNLTDMWRAGGADPSRKPAEWLRSEVGARFVAEIAQREKVGENHLFSVMKGRGGGTFGHWQVGMAYAQYLRPAFHVWCNEVVRHVMEDTVPALPPAAPTVTFADMMQIAAVIGREIRGAVHDEVSAVVAPLDRRVTDLEATQARILADTTEGLALMRQLADKGRRHFSEATKNTAILAAHLQGDLCPACKRNRITNSDGTRAIGVEFHHGHSKRHDNSADNCTPLCRECHAEFSAAPAAAEAKYEKRIAAYHEARRERFGSVPRGPGPKPQHDPRQLGLAVPAPPFSL